MTRGRMTMIYPDHCRRLIMDQKTCRSFFCHQTSVGPPRLPAQMHMLTNFVSCQPLPFASRDFTLKAMCGHRLKYERILKPRRSWTLIERDYQLQGIGGLSGKRWSTTRKEQRRFE